MYSTTAERTADARSECGSELSVSDLIITGELLRRQPRAIDTRAEHAAMHALATCMVESPKAALKRLAGFAIELCGADTGGVSVIETDTGEALFRWQAIVGTLERFEGGSTPRGWSPCCETLRAGRPILFTYPERYFTYLQEVGPLVEDLVVPMYGRKEDGLQGTIWIVSHDKERRFDAEDVRIMMALGCFASSALRLRPQQRRANAAETKTQATAARGLVWAEYISRVGRGDEAALAALMDETRPLLFAIALRIVAFPWEAEETVADTFTQVWRTAATFDPRRGCADTWLASIARSRAIDSLRRMKSHAKGEAALAIACNAAAGDNGTHGGSDGLQTALSSLPFRQRRAVELTYLDGLTNSDVAAQLGLPAGTVKTQIRLGLIKLRRLLAAGTQ